MILCTSASGGVHTGLFKCTVKCIWSALETSLCVRVLFPWLILTFFATETSKPQGAEVRSQVRSKRSLRLNLSNQSIRRLLSKCQSSRATNSTLASENRFLNEDCWSPRNVGGFFSVLIHELVQKLHDFLFFTVFPSKFFVCRELNRGTQVSFWKISVRKTIWDLEFSEHLL